MRFAPRRREWIIGSAWRALKQTKLQRSFNEISYPDEPGLREPDSLHFFRIFKEQPNKKQLTAQRPRERTLGSELEDLVEPTGIEPVTSCLQSRRSPS